MPPLPALTRARPACSASGHPSIHLRNAEAVTARGEEISWPELLVRGRLLRYIDVPPEIDVRAAIADKQAAMLAGRMAYARKPKKAKT